jgi:hypothetical protein
MAKPGDRGGPALALELHVLERHRVEPGISFAVMSSTRGTEPRREGAAMPGMLHGHGAVGQGG